MLLRNVVSWNIINVKAKPLEQAMVLGLGEGSVVLCMGTFYFIYVAASSCS
jgi:hypothetical protein